MDIFKTYLFFEGHDEGHSYLIDTIFFEGQWWLVGDWLQSRETGEKFPGNMVCLSNLRFEEVKHERYRFLLNNALPKSLLDGIPREGYTLKRYPLTQEMPGAKGQH